MRTDAPRYVQQFDNWCRIDAGRQAADRFRKEMDLWRRIVAIENRSARRERRRLLRPARVTR